MESKVDRNRMVIKIKNENCVYENNHGTLFDDDVLFPSGVSGKYIRFKWKAPYSVGVLPVMENGGVALLYNFRHAIRSWCLEIPKGFGSKDIQPIEVAKKELLEETGIRWKSVEFIKELYPDPGFIANSMYLFVAKDCQKIQDENREAEEVIKGIKYISPEDLTKTITQIKDTTTLLALISHFKTVKF